MRMVQDLILLPVIAQVVLTLAILCVLGLRRGRALQQSGKSIQDMADARDTDWPVHADRAARAFKNQFEIPVLFYAVCAFAFMTRNVGLVFFVLAWGFVGARVVQTIAHLTTNVVAVRGMAYIAGVAIAAAMWVLLAINIARTGF